MLMHTPKMTHFLSQRGHSNSLCLGSVLRGGRLGALNSTPSHPDGQNLLDDLGSFDGNDDSHYLTAGQAGFDIDLADPREELRRYRPCAVLALPAKCPHQNGSN